MQKKSFGEIVAHSRKKKMTQEALAEKLNVTPQAISKWETGTGYPDAMQFPKIAGILGIPLEKLFGIEKKEVNKRQPAGSRNGLAFVAALMNRLCYSDKTVSEIGREAVLFTDGSRADMTDGTAVNVGTGEYASCPTMLKVWNMIPLKLRIIKNAVKFIHLI